jgi:hypothetical protein
MVSTCASYFDAGGWYQTPPVIMLSEVPAHEPLAVMQLAGGPRKHPPVKMVPIFTGGYLGGPLAQMCRPCKLEGSKFIKHCFSMSKFKQKNI